MWVITLQQPGSHNCHRRWRGSTAPVDGLGDAKDSFATRHVCPTHQYWSTRLIPVGGVGASMPLRTPFRGGKVPTWRGG